jgi:hypothetical protein
MPDTREAPPKQAQTDPSDSGALEKAAARTKQPSAPVRGRPSATGNSQHRGGAQATEVQARLAQLDAMLAQGEASVAALERLRQAHEQRIAEDVARADAFDVLLAQMKAVVIAREQQIQALDRGVDELLQTMRAAAQAAPTAMQALCAAAKRIEEDDIEVKATLVGQLQKIDTMVIAKRTRNRGRGKAERTQLGETLAKTYQRLGREIDTKFIDAFLLEAGAQSEAAAQKARERIVRSVQAAPSQHTSTPARKRNDK